MPLVKKITVKGGVVGIWQLSEKPGEFGNLQLSSADSAKFNEITYEKRKVEFLAVRALLLELAGERCEIGYHPDGRPYLPNKKIEISISHSKDFVAVILNKNQAGIDIEVEGREINKIAKKFLSGYELLCIEKSTDKERSLLLYWCAKEAIFKTTRHQGVDFRKQIAIKPFKVSAEGALYAVLTVGHKNTCLTLEYRFFKNNAVVWCVYGY
ncbi:Holo-[acyl-carrier protein] synthase [hydrothermal vent metagenome]|uniref:Holo-[acyl-carrier protein] synthase n=1 Tax=hydrothermal vent metagenome TaxID=652676 RepID=A0A3B0TJU6_9ZZZZ